MGLLLDSIIQQVSVMRSVNKRPSKLVCDADQLKALLDEVQPDLIINLPIGWGRVYLDVKISNTPNFEVV